eukprot:scaffold144579_cov33-Prasinocladus_malaysianus.AAC.1
MDSRGDNLSEAVRLGEELEFTAGYCRRFMESEGRDQNRRLRTEGSNRRNVQPVSIGCNCAKQSNHFYEVQSHELPACPH